MKVTQERFEDAGERDANGFYDYYYSGVIYRLEFQGRAFIVRRYDDTLEEASFQCSDNGPGRERTMFVEIPYQDAQFREAVSYLRDQERVQSLQILLSSGYAQIDLARLAS